MTARRTCFVLTLTALVGLTAGCAIQADSGPRDVPDDHPARGAIDAPSEGGEATGEGRIYLLAADSDGQRLHTVLRDPKDPIQTLILGPNQQETGDGLATAIPNTLEVNSIRFDGGVVVIDVSDDINDLTGESLRLAVAQIVFTASEIEGTEAVLMRVDGESQPWPNGEGEPISRPLTVYDFNGYAESSQPAYPVTPRSPASGEAQSTTTTVAATTTVPPSTVAGATTALPQAGTTTTPPTTG